MRTATRPPPPVAYPPGVDEWGPIDFDAAVPTGEAGPRPWACDNPCCRDKTRGWWLSVHGCLFCLNCRPPWTPELVARRGTAADAPMVCPDRATTIHGT